jgi:hypothetical protein
VFKPVAADFIWTQKGRTGLRGFGPSKRYLVRAFCETLVEAVHTAFRIDKFRAARKEWMAAGTRVDVHLFYSRLSFDFIAAGATNHSFCVVGVNIFLHV